MIIDSSAIMAILNHEPLAVDLTAAIRAAAAPKMSAGSWIELQVVSTRRYRGELDQRIERVRLALSINIFAVTPEQAEIARQAYRSFGLGSGSPARLNFGDCFAYALAKATGEPLLYVGDDFVHTDIASAL